MSGRPRPIRHLKLKTPPVKQSDHAGLRNLIRPIHNTNFKKIYEAQE